MFFDNEGNFERFTSTSSGTQTLTADNGKSVVIQFAQQYSDTEGTIDEAAGTITFVYTFKGYWRRSERRRDRSSSTTPD